jgi:hypothetical protein
MCLKFQLREFFLSSSHTSESYSSLFFPALLTFSQIFEAYQIVGAEHQNRVLAVVKSSGDSSALFSFAIANYPPINLSDLHINAVLPINETFLIDNSPKSGISSHQFQILSGSEVFTYYYYPDNSKEEFDRVLRKLIQGEC